MARKESAAHGAGSRTRRRAAGVVATLVVIAGLVAGGIEFNAHRVRPATPRTTAEVTTTTVVRTDLSNSQILGGTLGFGSATPVKGSGGGLVTELPSPGAVITRGHPLYTVNDQPVVLFYGRTPLFRTLDKPTMTGLDVNVVADNLNALGYDIGPTAAPLAPDADGANAAAQPGDSYTPSLSAAVKRWQKYIGMTQTGTLGVGQIVVLPGPVRVGTVQAQLGDPAAEPVLTVSPTAKAITVPVPAADLNGIAAGVKVTVTLPDARKVPGTVTAVSQAVQGALGQQDPDGENTVPTLNVTVTPVHSSDVAGLTSADVQVLFTSVALRGVLAVPVGALVALSGGGYALQRTDGRFVAVTTGMFADGLVQVSGSGVTQGLRVETVS